MTVDWHRYRRPHRLPWLARLIVRSWLLGSALGFVLAGLLVAADIARLGTLIGSTAEPIIAFALFTIGFATLFGSLYAASAVMLLPRSSDDEAWRHIEP